MSEKATERPWRTDYTWVENIRGPNGEFVAAVCHSGGAREANAELIVKAVNNYDELASIAGEMAEMMILVQGDCIFVDDIGVADDAEVPHTRGDTFNALSAALDRYNKWAEKNNG